MDIPSPASILRQPPHSGAEPLASCLRRLQPGHGPGGDPGLAELSRRWPQLVSTELASQSRPLALQGSSLLVAVNSPHWVQVLQYSRQLLLGRLRAAGFPLRSIRLQCREAPPPQQQLDGVASRESWQHHPSRSVASRPRFSCPRCGSPSPEGELERWGWCGFCQREQLPRPAMGDPGDTDRQREDRAR